MICLILESVRGIENNDLSYTGKRKRKVGIFDNLMKIAIANFSNAVTELDSIRWKTWLIK